VKTGEIMIKPKKRIRDLVYGFIGLDEQECEIIDHPAFQRLRRIVLTRNHYKCIKETQTIPTKKDLLDIQELREKYKGKKYYLDDNELTSWYRLDKDIYVYEDNQLQPLSEKSSIIRALIEKPRKQRFYVERV